ncbi:MAG: PBP1A family penicillin-binding protein [Myxococcaceae bacterium]|nr:PBP1A family penicillin-binding protein [Myxococcaceae bacterium]MCI0672880.1 PBP1A family penicillin-binding protein [Myxococcaceae bacterium]
MARSSPSPGARLWRLTKRLFLLGVTGVVLLLLLVLGAYVYFDRDLPSVEALRSYQPPQVTKVTCADGAVCAEFFRERNRRTLVRIEDLPKHVKNAFLAAEDAEFYAHQGLDYVGMLRAALKALRPGARLQGASTISQQVCKNMLLTQERVLGRKIRELILTPRLEKALTKDQILNLYINQNYFGHGRYGIEEAALFYFGKHAKELSVGEAASLAGTVQLPHRINPLTNLAKAAKRQHHVLGQMAQKGFIPAAAAEREMKKPLVLAPRPPEPVGGYYAEELRRTLIQRYGEKAVLEGGMRVSIAMDPALQRAAEAAVRQGLEAVDRRQGYRGPVGTLDAAAFQRVKAHVQVRITEAGKRQQEAALVADLEHLAAPLPEGRVAEGAEEVRADEEEVHAEEEAPDADELRARGVALRPLKEGMSLTAFVTSVQDRAKVARLDVVGRTAELAFSTVTWARKRGVGKWTPEPKTLSDVMKPGDLVRVRVLRAPPAPAPLEVTLDQVPEVQGGLVVIDPATRHVVAMVGGYDFERSPFNRATQAHRQPGSSFKPFLYAAALATGQFTTVSVVNDAPEAIRDEWTGKVWKPQNYEKDSFEGPMSLRQALTRSKNTVSVRLIQSVTPAAAIDFARRAGIQSELPENLTLALGTGEVTMLEIANAYATLHSLGRFAEPLMLLSVRDADGKVLEEHSTALEERLTPAVAYLTTSLMQSVVEEGTAIAVKSLNRPAAGKTGTASEYRDAWFSGYTADLVASAWVGFDNHDSLGRGETGGRAALPIWLTFMEQAHTGKPARDFGVPAGVVFAQIDPATGLLAGDAVPGRPEPFLDGTAPTAAALPPGQVDPSRLFLEEGRRGGL